MEQLLSERMKAILVKIGLELKKFGWKANSQTSEIDVHQGHLEMYREFQFNGDSDLPDVGGSIGVDIGFVQNEQNGVYFMIYNIMADLSVDGVGSTEKSAENDWDQDFSDAEANNLAKIQSAAKEVHRQSEEFFDEKAYEFAQESYEEWRYYHDSGTAKADREDRDF